MDTLSKDFTFQLFTLVQFIAPVLLFIIVLIFVIRVVRRMERYHIESLKLAKENLTLQQQQLQAISELNNRLTKIENRINEVD